MVDSTIANAFLKDTINKLNDYPTFLETFALLKEWILNWSRLESSAPKQDKEKISDFFLSCHIFEQKLRQEKNTKIFEKAKIISSIRDENSKHFYFFQKTSKYQVSITCPFT